MTATVLQIHTTIYHQPFASPLLTTTLPCHNYPCWYSLSFPIPLYPPFDLELTTNNSLGFILPTMSLPAPNVIQDLRSIQGNYYLGTFKIPKNGIRLTVRDTTRYDDFDNQVAATIIMMYLPELVRPLLLHERHVSQPLLHITIAWHTKEATNPTTHEVAISLFASKLHQNLGCA